jgi:hypothetical protein
MRKAVEWVVYPGGEEGFLQYIKGILRQQGTVDSVRFRQQAMEQIRKALVAEKNEKVKV